MQEIRRKTPGYTEDGGRTFIGYVKESVLTEYDYAVCAILNREGVYQTLGFDPNTPDECLEVSIRFEEGDPTFEQFISDLRLLLPNWDEWQHDASS